MDIENLIFKHVYVNNSKKVLKVVLLLEQTLSQNEDKHFDLKINLLNPKVSK